MKVLFTNEAVSKLKQVAENVTIINQLDKFVSSINDGSIDLQKNTQLVEDNIFVYKMNDLRLFYSIQEDNNDDEVLIIVDFVNRSNLSKKVVNRNPKFNTNINPKFNTKLNPKYNTRINPTYNTTINPKYNTTINPNYNTSINPKYNTSINPKYNTSINPSYNNKINPAYNTALNPNYNPSFDGLYQYNLDLDEEFFIVKANNNILVFFSKDLECKKYAIRHKNNGFVVFDYANQEWIEHMVSDGKDAYNLFNTDNEWVGIIK